MARASRKFFFNIASWLALAISAASFGAVQAEPLRIAYTSIAVVYGPLWLTKEAGLLVDSEH
jgi:hypothetical protein